jgi:macrolide-specific efflux system membrane fusion protein
VSTVKVVGGSGKVTPVTVTLGIVGNVGTQIVTGLKVGQTVSLGVVAASTGSSGTGRAGFGGGAGGFGTRTGGGGGGFGGGPGGGTSTRGGN